MRLSESARLVRQKRLFRTTRVAEKERCAGPRRAESRSRGPMRVVRLELAVALMALSCCGTYTRSVDDESAAVDAEGNPPTLRASTALEGALTSPASMTVEYEPDDEAYSSSGPYLAVELCRRTRRPKPSQSKGSSPARLACSWSTRASPWSRAGPHPELRTPQRSPGPRCRRGQGDASCSSAICSGRGR